MRPLAVAFCCILGCGGAEAEVASTVPAVEAPSPPAERERPPPEPPAVTGAIARSELLPVLDAGLARFLEGVETEPHLEGSKFVGFRLRSLWPEDERFRAVDLGAGDVVTRVNGQPIERPEQALRVWNSLRVASELLIEYRRDGEPRELRFAIVD